MSYGSFDLRQRMGRDELSEAVIEAALDQPSPTPELRATLQRYLAFTKHRHRVRPRGAQPVEVEDGDE